MFDEKITIHTIQLPVAYRLWVFPAAFSVLGCNVVWFGILADQFRDNSAAVQHNFQIIWIKQGSRLGRDKFERVNKKV